MAFIYKTTKNSKFFKNISCIKMDIVSKIEKLAVSWWKGKRNCNKGSEPKGIKWRSPLRRRFRHHPVSKNNYCTEYKNVKLVCWTENDYKICIKYIFLFLVEKLWWKGVSNKSFNLTLLLTRFVLSLRSLTHKSRQAFTSFRHSKAG